MEIFVANGQGTVLALKSHVLVYFLHLLRLGRGVPVAKNNAVVAEIGLVGPVSEHAAVSLCYSLERGGLVNAVSGRIGAEGLVHEIPDGSAHHARGRLEGIHVLLEITQGIPHGVGIFAHEKGAGSFLLPPVFHPVHGRIHGGIHIHGLVAVRKFAVMEGPRSVISPDSRRCRLKIGTVAGLIAQGPENNGRVVLGTMHHAHIALHMGFLPGRLPGNIHAAIADAVGFAVGFVHHVQAVAVAQLIKIRMIGIVGTTDGIDIMRLDNLHVLFHHFPRNGAPVIGMGFMAVDTLELDGSAVNQHGAVIRNLHGTEPDIDGTGILSIQRISHPVQVGRFRRPWLHTGKFPVQGNLHLASGGNGGNLQRSGIQPSPVIRLHAAGTVPALPVQFGGNPVDGIIQLHAGGNILFTGIADGERSVQYPGCVILPVQSGLQEQVTHVRLRLGKQGHVPENAGKAQEILVLQVRTVAPAVYFHGNRIPAGPDIGSKVKLRPCIGIFGIADLTAIYPHIKGGLHPVKPDHHLLSLPGNGQIEIPAVGTHGITLPVRRPVLGRFPHYLGRIRLEWIGNIRVNGRSITVKLPVGRNLDRIPSGNGIRGVEEIGRPLVRSHGKFELPIPVQAQRFIRCRKNGGSGSLLIDSRHLFIFPIRNIPQQGKSRSQTHHGKQKRANRLHLGMNMELLTYTFSGTDPDNALNPSSRHLRQGSTSTCRNPCTFSLLWKPWP